MVSIDMLLGSQSFTILFEEVLQYVLNASLVPAVLDKTPHLTPTRLWQDEYPPSLTG